jgi:ribosomal protein S18 acetylase RimI-like enzyme
MITIRKATEKDLPVLETFEQGIVDTERPFDSTLKEGIIHYYDLGELIQSTDTLVLVAEEDGEILASGYAQIRNAQSYLKHEQYAYLGFMFVRPAFRGMGLNKKLLDELISWSRHKRISEIRLNVYAENGIAKTAYEKSGFKIHMLEMRLSV